MTHFLNNKSILAALAILSASNSMALTPIDATHSSRDISEKLNVNNKERFIYNKGFKDGYEVGKRKGYEEAFAKARAALEKYKSKIEAYESGKYLTRKGKVTPPRIYQKRDGNGHFTVIVKGCEVRGELSPSDILKLPVYQSSGDEGSTITEAGGRAQSAPYSNGIFLNGIDRRNAPIAKPTSSLKQVNTIVLRDTKFYRDLLRSSGVLFSIEENGGGLKAVFSSPKERKNFIRNYNLEYGKDYK